jgi:hypothetical protein
MTEPGSMIHTSILETEPEPQLLQMAIVRKHQEQTQCQIHEKAQKVDCRIRALVILHSVATDRETSCL